MVPYFHSDLEKNKIAADEITKLLLLKLQKPSSVLDLGCGLGALLSSLKENLVETILGIDGNWVNKNDLFIPENVFLEHNLSTSLNLNRRFDWAICLEVAEHLPEKSSEVLVENLTKHSDIIIFSAAPPMQGGQNHINEQPFAYWFSKFEKRGFVVFDVFRKLAWDNEKIPWWYRQNLFLIAKSEKLMNEFKTESINSNFYCYWVHPMNYLGKMNRLTNITNDYNFVISGKAPLKLYCKCLVLKFKHLIHRVFSFK